MGRLPKDPIKRAEEIQKRQLVRLESEHVGQTTTQSESVTTVNPADGLTEKIEDIKKSVAETVEKKQRKQYTKRNKDQVEETPLPAAIEKGLEPITKVLLEFVNSRMPNPEPVVEIEVTLVAESLKPVLQEIFPKIMEYSAWVGLTMALSMFAIPRLIKEKKEKNVQQEP